MGEAKAPCVVSCGASREMYITLSRQSRGRGLWLLGVLVGFCLTVAPWSGACSQEKPPATVAQQTASPKPGLPTAVQQGRLSVNLLDADIIEVLDAISAQAGITLRVIAKVRKTVNAQFSEVALDEGLRRLMHLPALSYAMRYAPDPAGASTIKEVFVLGEGTGGAPAPPATEAKVEEGKEGEAVRRLLEVMEKAKQSRPPAPTDLSRLKNAQQN
jgi:hypothetical protein